MPLSKEEWQTLLPSLGLTKDGIDYLNRVRLSPPARRVQSHGVANCCYRYVSRKMGCALMGESRLEYQFLLRCEFDLNETVEYWEQPTSVPIEGVNAKGRRYRAGYVADVLVITRSDVIVYEVKPFNECLELCAKRPQDWLKSSEGFEYRPAKDTFQRLGITHRVLTDRELDQVESTNLEPPRVHRRLFGLSHAASRSALLG